MNNNQELKGAIEGIKKGVQGEREDELFYQYLINVAPTNEEKEIISSIRDDERMHNRAFRKLYEDFTGTQIEMDQEDNFQQPESYFEGIKEALFGELSAVERYRNIRRGLRDEEEARDILFDIITDELKHASKYNYLFTLNNGMSVAAINKNNTNTNTNEDMENMQQSTPDDWVKYITPLVNLALEEQQEGINQEHLYQEYILAGVLVGLGKNPQDAIEQVEEWEKTGTSKLLAMSKMSRYFNDL